MLSEAVKWLKGEYCVKAILEHKMDQAIIFCRTKVDCDNLESYLNSIGNCIIYVISSMLFYTLLTSVHNMNVQSYR